MNTPIFDMFNNKNLSPKLIILKRIGQAFIGVAVIALSILQVGTNQPQNTPFFQFVSGVLVLSFFIISISFGYLAIVSTYKSSTNTNMQAAGKFLSKVFLYMFLPAIVITAILTAVFILPPVLWPNDFKTSSNTGSQL